MSVDPRTLRPSPLRDFIIDPIDDGHVESLRVSIREFGFWGGVVCRRGDGGALEICDGHHRIAAAVAEGLESVDVTIASLDDRGMIVAAARAQALQDGRKERAVHGVVLAACRAAAGSIPPDKRLTWGPVCRLIDDVPGFGRRTVRRTMKTLASSGLIP